MRCVGMAMSLITNEALIAILRLRVASQGGSRRYADRLGVSCAFVSEMMAGRKLVCGRILRDLGYERVGAFKRAGGLGDEAAVKGSKPS